MLADVHNYAINTLFIPATGGALGVKQVNAAGAVEGLTSDPKTVLVDIRGREEVKGQGSPDLSSTKKKAIILPFTRVKPSYPFSIVMPPLQYVLSTARQAFQI